MVSKTEETQLNRLENQVDNGGGGAWEYLCLARKLKVWHSEKVLKYGLSILNDSKKRSSLGPEEWTLYEQVAIAAIDCQCLDVAKCNGLNKDGQAHTVAILVWIPKDAVDGRLEGMLLEVTGSWAEAEKAYSSLLEDNPLDQVIILPPLFRPPLPLLSLFPEPFMADHDAWRELAEIYVSLQMYKQAAFCYEELILSQPTVPLYHLANADVLYTLGGFENLEAAKKY
ncbi:hypothetical protein F3Y22_tig00110287pilonHSYRG00002 [Hibiscus syriacus]|uniref:ER membrane protein complex subunit 2 n=1 Tax=Hibiscus syriacus TaxID=106335 RepID=A0A6A3B8D3_HIBSY|nr:hypothetical protein F3Y22_tig00110287pilonHSYRG00002 [Hibiscus syriacus]